jgi:hypothetical protein
MFTDIIDLDDDMPEYEDRYKSEDDSRFCRHGYLHAQCKACENEDDCDIDKCLNCGRYRASSSLDRYQVCAKGCVNPNEY